MEENIFVDPPSAAVDAPAYRAHMIKNDLLRAAQRVDAAYHASHAVYSLHRAISVDDEPRPDLWERNALIEATMQATPAVLSLFHTHDLANAIAALGAVSELIVYWAEDNAARAARRPGGFTEMNARARWLRNALHNVSLLADIEAAKATRTRSTVSGITKAAMGNW